MRYKNSLKIEVVVFNCFKRNILHSSWIDNNSGILTVFVRVFRSENITVADTKRTVLKKQLHFSSISNTASAVLEDLKTTSSSFALAKNTRFTLQLIKVDFNKSALINRLLYKLELLNEVLKIDAPAKL